jgi:hypothetical protein
MMSNRQKLSRRLDGSQVTYRGKARAVVVEIDRAAGTVAVRLHGCKTRRLYAAADLWKTTTPQLSLL